MRSNVLLMVLISIISPLGSAQAATKEVDFPDDGELSLLLVQTERAFAMYEQTTSVESATFGDKAGASQDREVVKEFRAYFPDLQKHPQAFNSPAGFLVIMDLNHAARNMSACMAQGLLASNVTMLATKNPTVTNELNVATTCSNVALLLYTVSESATQLYEKYLLANHQLQQKQQETIDSCVDVVKTRCVGKDDTK